MGVGALQREANAARQREANSLAHAPPRVHQDAERAVQGFHVPRDSRARRPGRVERRVLHLLRGEGLDVLHHRGADRHRLELPQAFPQRTREADADARDSTPGVRQHRRGYRGRRWTRARGLAGVARPLPPPRHRLLLRHPLPHRVEHQAPARGGHDRRQKSSQHEQAHPLPTVLRHGRRVHLLHADHRLPLKVHGGVQPDVAGGFRG